MKVKDLTKLDGFEVISLSNPEKEINDIYTGDLLSWVMGHVREEGTLLFTVLNSINLIAVSTLLDISGVVFCEGVNPTEDIINKAKEEGINLFKTNDTTFHSALKVQNIK